MHSRPWHQVLDFYSNVVKGSLSLSALFGTKACHVRDEAEISQSLEDAKLQMISPKERSGRWERVTFKVTLSYHGDSFDGWQKQPGLNTVQGIALKEERLCVLNWLLIILTKDGSSTRGNCNKGSSCWCGGRFTAEADGCYM